MRLDRESIERIDRTSKKQQTEKERRETKVEFIVFVECTIRVQIRRENNIPQS